jgi:hypothetical protein
MISASPGLRDFLGRLLVLDPNKRFTAKDALKHPWIKHAMSTTSSEATRRILREAAGEGVGESRRRTDMSMVLLFRCIVHIVIATQRMIYLRKTTQLRRNGADLPILRCYSFLVSGRCDVTQFMCSGLFAYNPRLVGYLLPMVECATSLEVLDLSNNNMESMDLVQQLVKAVTNHPSLVVLNIENNPIPALAGRALLRLARGAGRLRAIRVGGTLVAADIVQMILAALKDKRALGVPVPSASAGVPPSGVGASPVSPLPTGRSVGGPPPPSTPTAATASQGTAGVDRNSRGGPGPVARGPPPAGSKGSATKFPPIPGAQQAPQARRR